jgi:hypothetical protein
MKYKIILLAVLLVIIGGVIYFNTPAPLGAISNFQESWRDTGDKLIIIDKRTNEVVPDFQGAARADTLIGNATRSTGASSDKFEVIGVSQAIYDQLVSEYKAQFQVQRDVEKQQRQATYNTLLAKSRATWSEQELLDLEDLILHGSRVSNNPVR